MSEHRLNEIVIERPRSRGNKISLKKVTGYKKALQKLTAEASEDGLLRPYLIKRRQPIFFSDHLGPLRRLLLSKVGQPWDDVYSELCRRLDTNTLTGRHVLFHVWGYVERHVVLIDGVPYAKGNLNYPLSGWRRFCLYVHPETGILCSATTAPADPPKKPDDVVVIDAYHQYRKLDGVWYFITFQKRQAGEPARKRKNAAGSEPAWDDWYSQIYQIVKRQCGKKEIKFILKRLAET
jgi:hypothetical protein